MTDSSAGTADVLVVGAGPAGCGAAIRLARSGHRVTVLERRTGTTPTVRGDALIPSAVDELRQIGVDARVGHRVDGVTLSARGRRLDLAWPRPESSGYVLQRDTLNAALRERAAEAGATVVLGAEAQTPIVERGFVRGARAVDRAGHVHDHRGRFVVVADGAASRFGRALGTVRERSWPYAITTSTYFESPRSDVHRLEIHLDLTDPRGTPMPGHGWVHPLGDGRVNVGVVLLSSFRDVLGVNTIKLLREFIESVADAWGFDATRPLAEPVRRRTPLGGSVGPKMGPTFLVIGDAAGVANPFDGHGVRAALLTGRLAAEAVDEGLGVGTSASLQRFPVRLQEVMGSYHQVGRLTARFLGRPSILRPAVGVGMRSESIMGAALRIATGELRREHSGGAERILRLATVLARFAPSW
ncbi:MAG: geranylgeranyl reductase family protein [Actinomycetota bacterium]